MNNKLFWCTNCLSMSTRPRISFDKHGKCNACQWQETKKKIDWNTRKAELSSLLEQEKINENFKKISFPKLYCNYSNR